MARNPLPLKDVGLKDMPDCQPCGRGPEKTTEHTFFHCSLVCPFWGHVGELTARIHTEQLVSIGLAYVCYNGVAPVVCGEMVDAFHVIGRGKNDGVDDSKGGNLTKRTQLSSGSDWILEHQVAMKVYSRGGSTS